MSFALLFALQAAAAAPPVACPAIPVALPAPLAGWLDHAAAPMLGKRFTLASVEGLAGLTASEKARPGLAAQVAIMIARAGNYSVALSDAAWIDVTAAGKTLTSTGHGHGPACSGIRKLVRFDLEPGRYSLRLSGVKAATIDMAILQN
jgi:hypothetical protein